ncbi:MAG TPA: FAD-dependent oxidoreductase [Aggregatilineales bacterium]|nr:FAD-dependent oxidoreductase [Aggregatilineales bacterium]
MPTIGTAESPLRVAIIGSGPSGFYTADFLLKQDKYTVQVDMYDRLPTPYGLVRGGVAPDHPKIKTVTKVYDKTATNPNFHFFGNVEVGKDISDEELRKYYHQVVYAVGARSDRRMGIPGEALSGSFPATEFVGWYNAHPDYRDLVFDLSQEAVAVIGNGNVAMDVVRILASSYEELRPTDIADYALEALRESKVRDIYMVGRRGPAQASFTNPELKELGELADADVIVPPDEIKLDPLTEAYLREHPDTTVEKNLKTLNEFAQRSPAGRSKRIHIMFLASPVELTGNGHVEAMRLVRNELYVSEDGSLRPRPTDRSETLAVGLVFRSIGYKGVALPGMPFDDKAGIIPNVEGRVIDPVTRQPIPGAYVTGWIKRGPSGVIGTNKPDSSQTAEQMLTDVPSLAPLDPGCATIEAVKALFEARHVKVVTFDDWRLLDAIEIERGQAIGRPRLKFSRIPNMLAAIDSINWRAKDESATRVSGESAAGRP